MVENLPANAGHTGSVPALGGSYVLQGSWAHAHNYWASAPEPISHNYWAHTLEPMLHNKKKQSQSETHAPHLESSPHSLQLEKDPKQQQKIQRSQKQNF